MQKTTVWGLLACLPACFRFGFFAFFALCLGDLVLLCGKTGRFCETLLQLQPRLNFHLLTCSCYRYGQFVMRSDEDYI